MGKQKKKGQPLLIIKNGMPYAWEASWSEPGKGRRRKEYCFGHKDSFYKISQEAYEAASDRQSKERSRWHKEYTNQALALIYHSCQNMNEVAEKLSVSYPTACKLIANADFDKRNQGYNKPFVEFTGLQCRSAREYLNYTREELCTSAGVSVTMLRNFELNNSTPRRTSIEKIKVFFTTRNIIFQNDETTFVDAGSFKIKTLEG